MVDEIGFVKQTREFIAFVDGLPSAKINDLVENEAGVRGLVSALSRDSVEIWILDEGNIQPGQTFKSTNSRLTVPLGNFLLGRAINPLGVAIDGRPPFPVSERTINAELDSPAPGISARKFIDQQLVTGITILDSLIPVGKGQRELVLSDARSGKQDFLINIIVNQKKTGVICIFAAIGKPLSEVRSVIDILRANEALDYTVIVATASSDPAPLIFVTPQTAFTIAEFFQKQGKDVLVILDDLGNHAKIYREIALLGNRSPGKESYPGDIFYVQAHLLERAGNFQGGGSITALPVIEINLNDFTTFIPTNLMSMTDGHLMFKAALRSQGKRPAIDTSLSVSRVGRQTQVRIVNLLSQQIRQVLSEAQSLETVSRFSSELPMETQIVLKQADILTELISQEPLTKIPIEVQLAVLGLVFTSFLRTKNILKYKKSLFDLFLKNPRQRTFATSLLNLSTMTQLINKLEEIVPKI